jgi:hypothetical protein
MQIWTKNNRKLEKPSRNLSYRTEVKILKRKDFLIAHQKNWICVCLVTMKMFENRNSGKKIRKRIKIFSKIDQGHIRF